MRTVCRLLLVLSGMLALHPVAFAGGLDLTNVRPTYGELGGTRPKGSLLPGDVYFVAFDIEGIAVDAEGKVAYTMSMELVDKTGKAIWKQDPAARTEHVPLGGNRLPGRAFVSVGLDMPSGEYVLKVSVTDTATKSSKTLESKFDVLPKDFGIVAVYTTVDEGGKIPATTTCIAGQSVFVQFGVVGFGRGEGAKKQPNIEVEMVPVDESGKPTLQKPLVVKITEGIDETELGINLRYLIPMTRTGKFTLKLKATDNTSKKTSTFDLPLTVIAPAN